MNMIGTKTEYQCGEDRKPKWVTIDLLTGETLDEEKYSHQDGNFSNLCSSSFCRCQE